MISAATETAATALNGTRLLVRRRKSHHPGMPRSRENAYQVRDALVRPAAPQKSCPTVAMMSTIFTPQTWLVIAVSKMEIDEPPALLMPSTSCAANRKARSTAQPAIAE